jgi:hypothetical protein
MTNEILSIWQASCDAAREAIRSGRADQAGIALRTGIAALQKFDESEHPRDETGKFAEKEGESGGVNGNVTDTSEFKRWFDDSKIVNDKGEPLIVYHGTKDAEITGFKNGKIIWKPKYNVFDTEGRIEPGIYFTPDINVASLYGTPIAYYLKAENVIKYENPIKRGEWPEKADAIYRMRGKGNSIEKAWEIAVKSPNQIKLALGNNGKFDPKNSAIDK